ncbi:hypothetical protein AVEN_194191-1 [Araneus ventricosus]|uniref:Uncharacterized protein n=1 Tax=Araneus ventricosus TaxID=182803 RepID=A0A4Y2TQQ8_ARAVE|nr:hypothetical protein AVEN_194191-1 [Araneus ventricosus]
MNTRKTRRLKTMKRSKGTIVSRKTFLARYLEALINNTEKKNHQLDERKSLEEKRTVIDENCLVEIKNSKRSIIQIRTTTNQIEESSQWTNGNEAKLSACAVDR